MFPGEGCFKAQRLGGRMKLPEILSPAGDFEALKAALNFGADAVYVGGTAFSMRSSAKNFTVHELKEAATLLHRHGRRLYLACNILPRNSELDGLQEFLREAAESGIDALIISDPGVMELAKLAAPGIELHISTQAGVVNYLAASSLFKQGARRVILARELSLKEIACIRDHTPGDLELEAFVHGAMCMSFSGRCLLSNYLAGRDGNHGDCAQPCRWSYALCEEKRPGRYYPISEDERGTYLLNSKDLCMIGHIPELIGAGITSFKIEGRAKSAYYTAAVTNAYRLALDAYLEHGEPYLFDRRLFDEVEKVSHRDYCTGFYFGPIQKGEDQSGKYHSGCEVVAAIVEYCDDKAVCSQKNLFRSGEALEAFIPGGTGEPAVIGAIYDENLLPVETASKPDGRYLLDIDAKLPIGAFLRRGKMEI